MNTSMLSMQAFGLPGRLIISVLPRMTDCARESIACLVNCIEAARTASAMPGASRVATASVASRRRIARGESGAARGQDQIQLTLVCQTNQLCFQCRLLVRQQNLLDDLIAAFLKTPDDCGSAFVLAFTARALIRKRDDRRLPRTRRFARLNHHFIAHVNRAGLQNAGKNALARHDAVAHLLINLTMAVTFLANLRHFQQNTSAAQQRSHRQGAKIKAIDHEVFAERAGNDPRALLVEGGNLVRAQQADLPMPLTRVGIAVDAPVHLEIAAVHVVLLNAAAITGTYPQ